MSIENGSHKIAVYFTHRKNTSLHTICSKGLQKLSDPVDWGSMELKLFILQFWVLVFAFLVAFTTVRNVAMIKNMYSLAHCLHICLVSTVLRNTGATVFWYKVTIILY